MNARRCTILGSFVLSILVLCGPTLVLADIGTGRAVDLSNSKLNQIENNLIAALESASPTLQASAAQVIRDIKASKPGYDFARSIIPLMRILKDENQELGVREMAALTLHEIGSDRGDFAIERESAFCTQPHLKRLCTWLTYAKVKGDLAALKASNSDSLQFISANK